MRLFLLSMFILNTSLAEIKTYDPKTYDRMKNGDSIRECNGVIFKVESHPETISVYLKDQKCVIFFSEKDRKEAAHFLGLVGQYFSIHSVKEGNESEFDQGLMYSIGGVLD